MPSRDTNTTPIRRRAALPRPIADEVVEMISARLRVLGEPNRIRLLQLLNDEGAMTVQEIADRMMTTHQNVSKHLNILHQAGMLSRRKEGPATRYELIDWTGWWVVEQIGASVIARLEELQGLTRGAA